MKECKPSFEKCIIDRCPYYHEFIEIVSGDVHMRIRCEKQDISLTNWKEDERMRLIDADRLLQGYEDHDFIDTHIVWNAPTIYAVPVIRCKDCSYHYGTICRRDSTFPWEDDDYCSKAEVEE